VLSPIASGDGIVRIMNKRMLAASLWLFAGWYLGAAVAVYLGLPDQVAPLPGIVMAVLIALDPTKRLWAPVDQVRDRKT
jgi:hypothetical protein